MVNKFILIFALSTSSALAAPIQSKFIDLESRDDNTLFARGNANSSGKKKPYVNPYSSRVQNVQDPGPTPGPVLTRSSKSTLERFAEGDSHASPKSTPGPVLTRSSKSTMFDRFAEGDSHASIKSTSGPVLMRSSKSSLGRFAGDDPRASLESAPAPVLMRSSKSSLGRFAEGDSRASLGSTSPSAPHSSTMKGELGTDPTLLTYSPKITLSRFAHSDPHASLESTSPENSPSKSPPPSYKAPSFLSNSDSSSSSSSSIFSHESIGLPPLAPRKPPAKTGNPGGWGLAYAREKAGYVPLPEDHVKGTGVE